MEKQVVERKVESYSVAAECANCNYTAFGINALKIPIGITVQNFLEKEFCPTCGCKTLRRA